jgi:hypothetical protein
VQQRLALLLLCYLQQHLLLLLLLLLLYRLTLQHLQVGTAGVPLCL